MLDHVRSTNVKQCQAMSRLSPASCRGAGWSCPSWSEDPNAMSSPSSPSSPSLHKNQALGTETAIWMINMINIWSIYDQYMINIWSIYDQYMINDDGMQPQWLWCVWDMDINGHPTDLKLSVFCQSSSNLIPWDPWHLVIRPQERRLRFQQL